MQPGSKTFYAGIDIGSTTAKVVVLDEDKNQIYEKYQRHFADIRKTVDEMLYEIMEITGDCPFVFSVTGSGGLSLSKRIDVPFVQEVISVTSSVKALINDVDVVIELGGEDAKIIFMTGGVDQRMNGICAGGTGAFIDQMAALLGTDASGLNEFAKTYTEIYPIAARCGVFAKSDIQPLINEGVSKENLAASIFQAVVNQTISGLACGRKIKGRVAFLGGPLFYLSELGSAFKRTLKLDDEDAVFPAQAHLFAAYGAALHSSKDTQTEPVLLSSIISTLDKSGDLRSEMNRLPALFEDEDDYKAFIERQNRYRVPRAKLSDYSGNAFLGIDAGSTTMKLALISDKGELLYSFYDSNRGDPAMTAKEALLNLYKKLNKNTRIVYSCSTGYGEALLKNAFHMDEGEVETISHFEAAQFFEPEVDCIIDIGGQDMKCIDIRDGCVDSIILNEACSSGCGSFIENFANSLGCTAREFAQMAVKARAPVDLGTRCTVFMNSNVKQAQKEGANVDDIAAGLAYSVVKNALFKVIKLKDASQLGEKFVVQGGTFYNDAVLRSFEIVSGHEAIRPDIAGLMGAYGAALIAKDRWQGQASTLLSYDELKAFTYRTKSTHCSGCQNSCRLTVNLFSDGGRFISGNRCEKGLDVGEAENAAPNIFEYKKHRLFAYEPLSKEEASRGCIGLPRVLNMYEDYPFWAVFFRNLGFRVVLSPFSKSSIYRRGMDSIPSESECYPAKLSHGHIEWLIDHDVRTIFYPCIYYERMEKDSLQNNFNCPMVISYPENIRNNVDSIREKSVRFISPFLSFTDEEILAKGLVKSMKAEFGIGESETRAAVHLAWEELLKFKEDVLAEGRRAVEWMEENDTCGIVIAGRPYHLDPEINHGIPEMVHSFGFAVFTEDSVAGLNEYEAKLRATNQWMYHARLYSAAQFVSSRDDMELIQLNSFGCGLDAITTDQVQDLMHQAGKMYTLLKIDEVNNLGSARIRVRSMIASMKLRRESQEKTAGCVQDYERREYTQEMQDKGYTILCTSMIPSHFRLLEAAMRCCGYNFVMMSDESQDVIDMGLKYVNNDACYPALIVVGQVMNAVFSGKYDTDKLAVVMVQTGGGCRASNYVGFIRKALKDAGYEHIPVVSVSANLMERNSGFHYTIKMGLKCLQALIYGDILMKTVHRVRPYEKVKGSANKLYEEWMQACAEDLLNPKVRIANFYRSCRKMIKEFDNLPTQDLPEKPRVGIVGEVLVKYMPIANNHLDEMLEEEGAEVIIPDFMDFLTYMFNHSIYRKKELGGSRIPALVSSAAMKIIAIARIPVVRDMKLSKRFKEHSNFKKMMKDARQVLSPGNQCGEGWFLAGEVMDLLQRGVNNIVCAQPFGCLPNHVVGKGIIKRMKELYPQLNMAAIDYDPGASKVNQQNRIKLMMEVAKENTGQKNDVSGQTA